MNNYADFQRFLAWANKEGLDTAHSVGDGKCICLSPQTAELWKAWKASKYTPLAVQEYLPSIDDLRRAGWSDEVAEEAMQAYATLRSSSNVADLKDAAQPAATDETGWLIEHSGEILPGAEQRAQVSWLRVQMKFNGYGAREFGFTHDANEALRFSRKEDAEAVLSMHIGASPPDWYSKPFSVTEHIWPAAPQPQAAPAPEPSAQAVAVTEEMVTAYLTANDAYWKRIDSEPTKLGKWRNGTPSEATRVSLMAALAASPKPQQAVPLTEPYHGKRYEAGDWSTRNWEAMCEDQQEGKS